MPTSAKVGIGCGILVVIGVIVLVLLVGWCKSTVGDYVRDYQENPERATAEMIVNLNPDLELIGSDNEAGTTTFRDKSGKETTLSWADLAEGRLTITDSEGTEINLGLTDMDSVPEWVPRLPDTVREVGSNHRVDQGKVTGAYVAVTNMETAGIRLFLDSEAQRHGMQGSTDTVDHSAGNQEMSVFGYRGIDGRSFSATVVRQGDGEAQVTFIYEEQTAP